ncbi:MAG TPA: BTAD domain-containing putative transcriptional regulator [Pseudonocardiaceae bacterium]|nr:BTAD domain-containing putative transcriptional regulator [Pseudonocardiaceae bacterium]
MRVGLLGPLLVQADDGGSVEIGGARLRMLLVRLALDPGRFVPPAVLVDALWGAAPPADASNALQSLVSRLRKALRPVADHVAEPVESGPAGYRLAVSPQDVDVPRFEALAADGHAQLRAGNPWPALATLTEALALWRGPSLADVADAPFAEPVAARLADARLAAVEDRIDAELAVGRHTEVLGELDALAAEYPLRETLAALRIRALYAAGRTADALAGYQRIRAALAEHLGVDPSTELRTVQLTVLRGEPPPRPAPEQLPEQRPAALPRLPAQLTSFVGRDADLNRAIGLLADSRLVCLVGPGGAGKTRLSIEVAFRHAEAHPGPVWFVELAPVDPDADLDPVVLAAIGARDNRMTDTPATGATSHRISPAQRLVEALGSRSGLLVLDNCEHLIGSAAQLAATLLDRCPQLRVLATSREPLAIGGETLHWVGPLALPSAEADVAEARSAAAVRLFVDRAAAARPGFELDDTNLAAVNEIVRQMDGMPLALELAAARLRSMTPTQVAERLDDRFRLLTGGNRVALPRHRTLRGVIEWSWELLTEPERTLARRLSVFAGGTDCEAAVGVCTGLDVTELAAEDVPYLLASLVEKSLLQQVSTGTGGPRYRMLETVRAYGRERLADAEETHAVLTAFVGYFLDLLIRVEPLLRGPDQLAAVEQVRVEEDNLRAAIRRALDVRDVGSAAVLVMRLGWYWLLIGRSGEIEPWIGAVQELYAEPYDRTTSALNLTALMARAERGDGMPAEGTESALAAVAETGAVEEFPVLSLAEPMLRMLMGELVAARAASARAAASPQPWIRAMGHMTNSFIAENVGDLAVAEAELDLALAGFRALGERWGLIMCLSMVSNLHYLRGDHQAAIESTRQGLRLAVELGSVEDPVNQLIWVGRLQTDSGDLDAAERSLAEALAGADRHGLTEMRLMALCESVRAACYRGDLDLARTRLAEAKNTTGQINRPSHGHKMSMLGLATVAVRLAEGDLPGRTEALAETMPYAVLSRDMPIVATLAEQTAGLLLSRGDARAAAELLGAAIRLRGILNQGDRTVARIIAEVVEALPAAEYSTAVQRWAAGSQQEAIGAIRTAVGLPAQDLDLDLDQPART